ncbi:hypothetical protein MNAN1_001534 [Malassezia nana]|uniref:Shwachman-Bodian-Diamond syndrome protein n=1 Tax=Malassezia nana TaxID=180528 RepID=A0AAF0EPR3_9BASI|nr:hypothetical protein MNAN1_001534 [Malassezia nana]
MQIACYKNKVKEWRTGVYVNMFNQREKDLDEVIQIENVFLNVSKGQVASNDDLKKAFGTSDTQQVLLEILKKGELQVGEKERSHELSNLWVEIATIVAQKCVEPSSQKPYTVGMIEKAMKDAHYSVKPSKSAKMQALDVIKLLQSKEIIPLQRAQMRVSVTMSSKEGKRLKDKVLPLFSHIEEEDWDDMWEIVGTIDPGSLRQINTLFETEVKGEGGVETLTFSTVEQDEGDDEW